MAVPRLPLVIACGFVMIACGSGEGIDGGDVDGGPEIDAPDDSPPLRFAFAEPAEGATAVPTNASVRVFFDGLIDPSTLTAESFTLVDDAGTPVQAVVAAWASGGVLTPSAPLSIDRGYIATITTAVTGAGGRPLEAAVSWSFSTYRRTWGTPVLVGRYEDFGLRVGMDSPGNAIALWSGYAADYSDPRDIFASRFVPEAGWMPREPVESEPGVAFEPQLAVNAAGDAAAVWSIETTGPIARHVWASRYTAGGYFDNPRVLDSDALGTVTEPQVALDPLGNVVVAWAQGDGIWATTFIVGAGPTAGWSDATQLAPGRAYNPRVGIDDSGHAVVVWIGVETVPSHVWAARFDGFAWEPAAPIESGDSGVTNAELVVDAAGNAVAAWMQGFELWGSRYALGTGWGTAGLVGSVPEGYGVDDFALAGNANGDVVAVWRGSDFLPVTAIAETYAARFTVDGGWETAVTVDTESPAGLRSLETGSSLDVAVDARGDAIAVWQFRDSLQSNLVLGRFTSGTGWAPATTIHTANSIAQAGAKLDVAMNANGSAVVAWTQQSSDSTDVWALTYR